MKVRDFLKRYNMDSNCRVLVKVRGKDREQRTYQLTESEILHESPVKTMNYRFQSFSVIDDELIIYATEE